MAASGESGGISWGLRHGKMMTDDVIKDVIVCNNCIKAVNEEALPITNSLRVRATCNLQVHCS